MNRPLVSFAVVAYNAERCLPELLADLAAQDYPPERIEALLVDSASTDGTRAVMEAFARQAPMRVRVLDNPARWLAPGINVALDAARGELFVRLDAHARIPRDFITRNVQAIAMGEDIVGGRVEGSVPRTPWQAVLTALDTSRFAGGAAPFRNAGAARDVDTLAYAMYRRSVYDAVGRYDERLRRTEDNEMHRRMRCAGYRFHYCPEIHSFHAARASLRGQLRQKWGNGLWVGRTMRVAPRCFAARHFIPALFVLALLGGVALAACGLPWPLWALLSAYVALDVGFGVHDALRAPVGRALCALTLPWLFPLVHIVYGLGTLCGLLTMGCVVKTKR